MSTGRGEHKKIEGWEFSPLDSPAEIVPGSEGQSSYLPIHDTPEEVCTLERRSGDPSIAEAVRSFPAPSIAGIRSQTGEPLVFCWSHGRRREI